MLHDVEAARLQDAPAGHVLLVAAGLPAEGPHLAEEVVGGEAVVGRRGVVGHPEGAPGGGGQVVREAGAGHRRVLPSGAAGFGQGALVGGGRVADDLVALLVLHPDPDDVPPPVRRGAAGPAGRARRRGGRRPGRDLGSEREHVPGGGVDADPHPAGVGRAERLEPGEVGHRGAVGGDHRLVDPEAAAVTVDEEDGLAEGHRLGPQRPPEVVVGGDVLLEVGVGLPDEHDRRAGVLLGPVERLLQPLDGGRPAGGELRRPQVVVAADDVQCGEADAAVAPAGVLGVVRRLPLQLQRGGPPGPLGGEEHPAERRQPPHRVHPLGLAVEPLVVTRRVDERRVEPVEEIPGGGVEAVGAGVGVGADVPVVHREGQPGGVHVGHEPGEAGPDVGGEAGVADGAELERPCHGARRSRHRRQCGAHHRRGQPE